MEPHTIETFNPDKIKAISSEKKSVGNVNYTSVKFNYYGGKMPPLRVDGKFKLFRFKKDKAVIYSLSIVCNEEKEAFFENLCKVLANEACRLVPKIKPESFMLVKTSKSGRNIHAKIYTRASGKAKCKVSALFEVFATAGPEGMRFEETVKVENKRVPVQLEKLIDESFEVSCILRLYHAYVGSTISITLSVEEILITDRETSNSYFD